MDEVVQEDGLGHAYTTRYFYEKGYFEPGKREFRGFGHVSTIDSEGSHKETYFYQDDKRKGRPKEELVKDRYDRLYSSTTYKWHYDLDSNGDPIYRTAWEGKSDFPALEEKTTTVFDPQNEATTKSTKVTYDYDAYGNATTITEYGFDDVAGDEREANITYTYDTDKWILSKPAENRIINSSGKVVSASKYYYDTNGALIKEEKWLSDTPLDSPTWNSSTNPNPTTEFTYYTEGNIWKVKDARGNITTTIYEDSKTFPISVSNALGHTQQFKYDPATGKITESIDPNGQVTKSTYDSFGRLVNVVGPASVSEVSHTYDLEIEKDPNNPAIILDPAKIVTTTKVNGAETVNAYAFIDGLGRQILTRVEAEYQGNPKHIVTGEVEYDSRGQVVKKYLPYYIGTPNPADGYVGPSLTTRYMTYEYDAMGRLVKTIRPDNKASYVIYELDRATSINENNQKIRQTKDAFGRIVKIEEFNEDENGNEIIYTTTYEYDTLGNLTKTTDNAANEVTIDYDTLGRKIRIDDPDMHLWIYEYDNAGNLTKQTDAKGQVLTFEYDKINRLIYKSTGADYIYNDDLKLGDTPQQNGIGRLDKITYAGGEVSFTYDILGREKTATKVVDGKSYTTAKEYDSLNRLTNIIYPDSDNIEIVYTYNKQGGIKTVGTPANPVSIVKETEYDEYGHLYFIKYGNDTETFYTYDPYTLKLIHITTKDKNGSIIQDLNYEFDNIGNIKRILDSIHESNTQYFSYDILNRLIQASSGGKGYGSISYGYDSLGNITTKGGLELLYEKTGNAGPHAVTSTTGSRNYAFEYDLNGNMLSKGKTRYTWDIENRIETVTAPKGGDHSTVELNLSEGWNFISLPFRIVEVNQTLKPIETVHIKDLLQSIDTKYEQVSKYDTQNNKWLHSVGLEKFDQFTNFECGEGYLIYIKQGQACTLTLSGITPSAEETKQLYSGWNLISAITKDTISVSEQFEGLGITTAKFYNGSGYVDASTLTKGNAYWVYLASTQDWIIPVALVDTNYEYDPDGGRIKRITDNKTNTYIGNFYEVEEEGNDKKTIKQVYMGRRKVCSIELIYENGSATPQSDNTYFTHTDHLGSSNLITDKTGFEVQNYQYKPFGELSKFTNNGYATDKRFAGKTYDESTNTLINFGARMYDYELGKFISPDPTIQFLYDPQTYNRYSYARNNPIRWVDVDGFGFWDWIGKLIGGIIGAIAGAVTGNPAIGIAVYSAISSGISAAAHGANIFQAMGVAAIAGVVGYAGGQLGVAYGEFIGAGVWGTSLLAGMFGGAAGGATGAALTGGNVGMGALQGAAAGATMGAFSGANPYLGPMFGSPLAGLAGAAVGGQDLAEGAIGGAAGWYGYVIGATIANNADTQKHRAELKRESKKLANHIMKRIKENRANLNANEGIMLASNDMNAGKAVGGYVNMFKVPMDLQGDLKLMYQIYGAACNYVYSGGDISSGVTIVVDPIAKEVTGVYPGAVDILSDRERAFWIGPEALKDL